MMRWIARALRAVQRRRASRAIERNEARLHTGELYRMPTLGTGLTLWGRAGGSDHLVFVEIFMRGDYDVFHAGESPRNIVDLGANVGYASAYFLARFPDARVLAIEPDAANLAVARRNLAPFGDRVTLVEGAVWSHRTGLCIVREPDVGEWGITMRECRKGETADLVGMDMTDVIVRAGDTEIDLLKIDIEGGERALFGAKAAHWLSRVRMLIVELHDDAARRAFDAATNGTPLSLPDSPHDRVVVVRR
ncbi:MAG: FkbM family methyltransferase [Gemmatimonadaceae bacterium]